LPEKDKEKAEINDSNKKIRRTGSPERLSINTVGTGLSFLTI
jgi:hypothetical protein